MDSMPGSSRWSERLLYSMRKVRGSACVFAILLFGAPAAADVVAAEQAFHLGSEAYARGDFARAAASFEEAFHDDPRAVTIYNAGLARQLAGDLANAADDYATALAMSDLTPAQATDSRTRLEALEASLGRLEVTAVGAVVSVGSNDKLPSPTHVHLQPGTYDVRASWPDGVTTKQQITVASGSEQTVTLAKPTAAPAPPVAPLGLSTTESSTPPGILSPRPNGRTGKYVVIASAGIVAVGVAAHVAMAVKRSELTTSAKAYDQGIGTFDAERGVAIGAYALGAIGLAVGAWLWHREVAPVIAPHVTGVAWTASW
jgi:hypothetical protein